LLKNPINVKRGDVLGFYSAKLRADQIAKESAENPILLAWYDSRSDRFSPDVTCCSEEKPGWLVYAETRGGNITIDINDKQYIFVYGDTPLT